MNSDSQFNLFPTEVINSIERYLNRCKENEVIVNKIKVGLLVIGDVKIIGEYDKIDQTLFIGKFRGIPLYIDMAWTELRSPKDGMIDCISYLTTRTGIIKEWS